MVIVLSLVESAGVSISSKTLNPDLLNISSKFDKKNKSENSVYVCLDVHPFWSLLSDMFWMFSDVDTSRVAFVWRFFYWRFWRRMLNQ